MTGKTSSEETSERKRIRIPKADTSVLDWWNIQGDVGLSIRLLIRNEIERSGYIDVAFKPVVQQPRRGRPPLAEAGGQSDDDARNVTEQQDEAGYPAPAPVLTAVPAVEPPRRHAVADPQRAAGSGSSAIDAIIG